MAKRIVIIGAGIAGLSSAYELKKKGYEVVVFEKENRPGGRMETLVKDEFLFDTGADFLNDNYTQLKRYASELGVEWATTYPGGLHRVIRGGEGYFLLLQSISDVFKMKFLSLQARIAFLFWIARLKFGEQLPSFYALSDAKTLASRENAFEYLSSHVHTEVATYVADAFVSIMQFHRASEISADALHAFVQMMIRPEDRFSVRYTPRGIAEIPKRLAGQLSVQYRAEITDLRQVGPYDACILATTAPAASALVTGEAHAFLETVRYARTITLAYRVPRGIFPEGLHISYVPFAENDVIGGYTNEGRKPGVVPAGSAETLMNVYLHEEAAALFAGLSDDEVSAKVLLELPKVFPELKTRMHEVTFHDLKRWERAMPKFSAAHVERVREFEEKHQGKNNIYLVGDYMNSPWTEGAARAGVRIAALVDKKLQ